MPSVYQVGLTKWRTAAVSTTSDAHLDRPHHTAAGERRQPFHEIRFEVAQLRRPTRFLHLHDKTAVVEQYGPSVGGDMRADHLLPSAEHARGGLGARAAQSPHDHIEALAERMKVVVSHQRGVRHTRRRYAPV